MGTTFVAPAANVRPEAGCCNCCLEARHRRQKKAAHRARGRHSRRPRARHGFRPPRCGDAATRMVPLHAHRTLSCRRSRDAAAVAARRAPVPERDGECGRRAARQRLAAAAAGCGCSWGDPHECNHAAASEAAAAARHGGQPLRHRPHRPECVPGAGLECNSLTTRNRLCADQPSGALLAPAIQRSLSTSAHPRCMRCMRRSSADARPVLDVPQVDAAAAMFGVNKTAVVDRLATDLAAAIAQSACAAETSG